MNETIHPNEFFATAEMVDELEPYAPPLPGGRLSSSFFSGLIQAAFGPSSRPAGRSGTAILFTALDAQAGVSSIASSVATELGMRGDLVLLADAQTIAMLGDTAAADRPLTLCHRIRPSTVSVLGPRQALIERPFATTGSGTLVLRSLQTGFQSLILDAPAISTSDIAMSFAASVQGVVFVAQAGQTRKRALRDAQKRFTSLGARVLGCVYNER